MGIRIRLITLMQILILLLLLVTVMRILRPLINRLSPGHHFKPLMLHCERPRPSMAPFLCLQKLLNFNFKVPNPDLSFHSIARIRIQLSNIMRIHADPDPCFKRMQRGCRGVSHIPARSQ